MIKANYKIGGSTVSANMDAVAYTAGEHNAFSPSLVESAFRAILGQGSVSANIYNNRPKSLSPTVSDFVVASMQGNLDDLAAYGDAVMNVTLFAKDVSGFKNGKKLSLMQGAAMQAMPVAVSITNGNTTIAEFEVGLHPSVIGDAPDDYGFHARMILFQVTIKAI